MDDLVKNSITEVIPKYLERIVYLLENPSNSSALPPKGDGFNTGFLETILDNWKPNTTTHKSSIPTTEFAAEFITQSNSIFPTPVTIHLK